MRRHDIDLEGMTEEEIRRCMRICKNVAKIGFYAALLEGQWPPKYSMCNSPYFPEVSSATYAAHMKLYSDCSKEITRRSQEKSNIGYEPKEKT